MRLYHFIKKEHGLENVQERRLKIARIAELNDPFEFAAVDLSDPWLRPGWEDMKQYMADRYGESESAFALVRDERDLTFT